MTILIIDDDAEDAMLLYQVIVEIAPNVRCIISNSYQAAKEFLDDETAPDFIFLNAMMYPIGGKEALIRLTQMDKLSDTVIIINSGLLTKLQVDEFTTLGADRVMQKAPDHHAMVASVKSILSR
ncbi:MAG TPA: response regulator [Chryseosolibacter sp.]|nr:response regulator [Chryseosolibacter sp.]